MPDPRRSRPPPNDRARIIVLGYLVRGPLGGLAWHYLQYVMGLRDLGHDVYFLEDSDDYPSCYDPLRGVTDTDPSYGLEFASHAFERIGLGDRWAYFDAHTDAWFGPAGEHIERICSSSDLLLNVSGVNPIREWLADIPSRALIDTDPAFTQIRHILNPKDLQVALLHTTHFSFGENVVKGERDFPDDGLRWKATRQPLVLGAWPVVVAPPERMFTTVMQWDSYPPLHFQGVRYGMKSDSFVEYIDLPERASHTFELALGSATAPRSLLRRKGWRVRDSRVPTRTPWSYQSYIRRSGSEFSVAKQGYVIGRTGWFSERSAAYLASGRPVLVQDTGFTDWLKTNQGVVPFRNMEEAVAGVEELDARYEIHSRAAREVAGEYFDARKVLSGLIEACLSTATPATGSRNRVQSGS
jgi:hypothetical protein